MLRTTTLSLVAHTRTFKTSQINSISNIKPRVLNWIAMDSFTRSLDDINNLIDSSRSDWNPSLESMVFELRITQVKETQKQIDKAFRALPQSTMQYKTKTIEPDDDAYLQRDGLRRRSYLPGTTPTVSRRMLQGIV